MPESIDDTFAQIGLPTPEVSDHWVDRLHSRWPGIFCTGDIPEGFPEEVEAWLSRVVSGHAEPGLIVGIGTKQTGEERLYYQVVEADFALLLRLPCDSANPSDESHWTTKRTLAELKPLLSELGHVRNKLGALPRRLVIVAVPELRPFWGWEPRAVARSAAADRLAKASAEPLDSDWSWRFDDNVLVAATSTLREL